MGNSAWLHLLSVQQKAVGDGFFTGPVSIVWLHALMQRLHPEGVTKRLPEAYAAVVEVIIYLE